MADGPFSRCLDRWRGAFEGVLVILPPKRHDLRVGAQHQDVVWVQIVSTQRVVELGLRAMIAGVSAPFTLTTSGPEVAVPDVVLFDVICMQDGDTSELDLWVKDSDTTVIAIERTLRPALGAQARSHGVEWSINLGISDADFVQVIREPMAGTLEDSDVAQEWITPTTSARTSD